MTAFEMTETGIYAPKPRGKRAIQITGAHVSQQVDGDSVGDVIDNIEAFLTDTTREWMVFQDPRFGETISLHRRFLETVQGVGYVWIDIEALEVETRERDRAVQNARKNLRR